MVYKFPISTAPMLDYSDTHCRYLWRLFSSHALLFTEMIHTNAILLGKRNQILEFHPAEHPIALQLGGNNPARLAQCAEYAEEYGYDEVNLNIGCPSNRVLAGQFGACLMRKPELVAECISAMKAKTTIPITVKTRLGIDNEDSYDFLVKFVMHVAKAGCDTFIIHARKAWLKGLSPKQNRNIPPLMPNRVHQLKKDFPGLIFILNGGLNDLATVKKHESNVDGVMLGREAYTNPYFLSELEKYFYGTGIPSHQTILEKYLIYVEEKLAQKINYKKLIKPLMGLFYGQPHARQWRTLLSYPYKEFSTSILKELNF